MKIKIAVKRRRELTHDSESSSFHGNIHFTYLNCIDSSSEKIVTSGKQRVRIIWCIMYASKLPIQALTVIKVFGWLLT